MAQKQKSIINSLDRRSFLVRSGMVVAGSTFGSSLLACATVDWQLPDLGSADPPAPVAGMTYMRASEIGCALDCDLKTGRHLVHGGEATDDGPRINAAMANASPSNPITLIIDGPALISGLFLPAAGSWGIAGLGYGTGFFIKKGTNNDGIHNGDAGAGIPADPGPPAPARGMNVSLSNFTMNGNQGDGHNGDSTTGAYQGDGKKAWDVCINLISLDNIVIENVVVVNSPSYHFRLSNVGNVTISGCVMRSNGNNTDGIHFDGPANDISITNCDITCGDDAIALNCPEGYRGNISRVRVTNCTFKSLTLMRLYSTGNGFRYNIDSVAVSQCTGTFLLAGLAIGDGTGANPDSVTGVTVSDCTLTSPTVLDITANFGTIALKNVTMIPTDKNFQPGIAFVRASARYYGPQTYIGASLTFENCAIAHDGGFDVAAIIMNYKSVIANMVFNGFATNAKALLTIVSGSIGLLTINSIDVTHIKEPVDKGEFAEIGCVNGTGVLATGWEFPDSVMANGVPYISANSNAPSIKVSGVAEPYPQA
jgi:hypothetical protein